MKTVSKILLGTVGGVVGFAALTAGLYLPLVICDAKKNHRDKCDYLMVLGGNVIGADTPSPQLFERMKAAAVYLKENTDCFIIPCGGCFRPDQKKSEARIISDYLTEQGIDENRIILEDKSTTTFENFEFALKIIESHSGKNVSEVKTAFLSSDYHVFRASKIAECCGFKAVGKVSCPTPEQASARYLREYIVAFELFAKVLKNRFSL
ncbi:MAG: YdcF family protein [Clostridia bacterium]|nr:YdcF family protein [Clostridia bacterium]